MPNFNSENPGTWFYFNPDDELQGGVCLRELSSDENRRIAKLTERHKKKFMRGTLVDDVKVDEELASKLRWHFCITDWKEVSLDGQKLECTNDNKVRMMKVIDFVKHVVDSLETLTEMNRSLEEARAKNLPSGSSDNVPNQIAKPVQTSTPKEAESHRVKSAGSS